MHDAAEDLAAGATEARPRASMTPGVVVTPEECAAPAMAVITHRVLPGRERDYEAWLQEIVPVSKAAPGHQSTTIIAPVPGATETYTVVIRFDTRRHLGDWVRSPTRAALIEKARPILAADDNFAVKSGLDFWFAPEGAKAQVPTRWKQALITWSAIYPLVLFVPLALEPLLARAGIGDSRYLKTLAITGVVVALMVWIVMPRYTKLARRWLYRQE